ncbi:hypothetical protein HYS72_03620 [Candidatus Pacearchaeota archaeon]|nr:hypothetical protein [Candidatus Pacearchaeota archaeon]MBI2056756.1 hypothetical protein [Candidatus Pacearchaeota archaeon]
MNKKGQELSTTTVILLILAVLVLVFLILGFSIGWSKINPFLSKSNVDSISDACNIACNTNQNYAFCSQPRDLKAEDSKLKGVTCNFLSGNSNLKAKYNLAECPAISCNQILSLAVTEEGAKADCAEKSIGEIVQYLEADTMKTYTCSAQDI